MLKKMQITSGVDIDSKSAFFKHITELYDKMGDVISL